MVLLQYKNVNGIILIFLFAVGFGVGARTIYGSHPTEGTGEMETHNTHEHLCSICPATGKHN